MAQNNHLSFLATMLPEEVKALILDLGLIPAVCITPELLESLRLQSIRYLPESARVVVMEDRRYDPIEHPEDFSSPWEFEAYKDYITELRKHLRSRRSHKATKEQLDLFNR